MNINFLKEDGEDFEVGDTVTIETTVETKEPFEESRTKSNVDDVEITITGYNDNTVVNSVSMSNNVAGEYFYNWDTTNESAGDYEIEVKANGSGTTEIENDWVKLTD